MIRHSLHRVNFLGQRGSDLLLALGKLLFQDCRHVVLCLADSLVRQFLGFSEDLLPSFLQNLLA